MAVRRAILDQLFQQHLLVRRNREPDQSAQQGDDDSPRYADVLEDRSQEPMRDDRRSER
jgi:hypothetical protein